MERNGFGNLLPLYIRDNVYCGLPTTPQFLNDVKRKGRLL